MPMLHVDGLDFDFPANWQAGKYDEWAFYRKQFSRMWDGIKSLDILAIDPQENGWLIEVKDYRTNLRTKPSELSSEVAHKVFDTLAALLPAKIHAGDPNEKTMARAMCGAKKLRVVLHLEQPATGSKLRPRAINPADIQQKLKQLLKPVDAHPFVAQSMAMGSLAWRVSDIPRALQSPAKPQR